MRHAVLATICAASMLAGCRTPQGESTLQNDAAGASQAALKNWDLLAAKASFAMYKGPMPKDGLIPNRDALKEAFGTRFELANIHVRSVGDLRYAILTNDREMAIVVRGTENNQETIGASMNWARNLDFTLHKLRDDDGVRCPWLRSCAMRVHRGFWNAAAQILEDGRTRIRDNKDKQIYFIGHSLGGAIAQLLMMQVYDGMAPRMYPYVFTYGAPKVANNWGNQGVYRRSYIRKWYISEDPIPRLPVGIINNTGVIHSFFGTNDLNATSGKRWVDGRDLPVPSISSHSQYVQRIEALQAAQDADTANGGRGFNTLRLAEDAIEPPLTSRGDEPLPSKTGNDFELEQTNDPGLPEPLPGQTSCTKLDGDMTKATYCFPEDTTDAP